MIGVWITKVLLYCQYTQLYTMKLLKLAPRKSEISAN